jgi:hypothetical protein
MPFEFIIPSQITLAGSVISIEIDPEIELHDDWGMYWESHNRIVLGTCVSDSVQFECFCHELSEAIAAKFVNQGKGKGDDVPHETIDAYGRGIFNFLIENAGRIIRLE